MDAADVNGWASKKIRKYIYLLISEKRYLLKVMGEVEAGLR